MINISEKMTNSKIEEVIAGGSNGSIVIFITKNDISLDIRCAWRLFEKGKVLISSNQSDVSPNSYYKKTLDRLLNLKIINISFSKVMDVTINFEDELSLESFCDVVEPFNSVTDNENWTICDKNLNICYSINLKFEITTGKL